MKLNDRTDAYSAALAKELGRRREEAGLSKNRLAEMAGLSQQMVSYVEKSVRIPTTATLYRLAEALGTTPGVILTAVDACPKRPKTKPGDHPLREESPKETPPGLAAEDPPQKTKPVGNRGADRRSPR
jgi:transcriptional regulator with XRE-family HTH domain